MTKSSSPIVCIVEDEMDILILLRVIVHSSRLACTISVHQSGADLLEFAKRNTISLIITDLNMFGMTGFDIASHIRISQPECVIAIVTAYATSENEKKAKELGIHYFIPKPFRIEDIESILHRVLA